MPTNTHIPVRSARRCIARPVVSKLVLVTAAAIATFSALAFCGALNAGPGSSRASTSAGVQAVSGEGYGYPIKPFDREHLIRANLGDPRTGFLGPPTEETLLHGDAGVRFHQGIDIASTPGTIVYPVSDGAVMTVTPLYVGVSSSGGHEFDYWHIRALVRVGQNVVARKTVLGRVSSPFNHVHLTELEGGRYVNPLARGRLTPYHDTTPPTVPAILLRRPGSASELLPNFVRGRVEIVAEAEDEPTVPPGRKVWHGPVAPALVTWQIRNLAGRIVVPTHVAADFRTTVPPDPTFWSVYARGTYQNQSVFGRHYSYRERGAYFFKLAPSFDTRTLRDGVYDVVVTAGDVRGNRGSQTLRFTVHNRPGWR